MRRAGYCDGQSSSGSTSSTPRTRTGLQRPRIRRGRAPPLRRPRRRDEGGPHTAGAGPLEQDARPVPPSSVPREPRASARRADRPLPAPRGRSRGTDRGVGRSTLRPSPEGKIRHVGVCNVDADQLGRALAVEPIVSVQNRFSLADRSSHDVLDLCERNGLAFIAWAPLAKERSRAPNGRSTRSRRRTTRRPARSRSRSSPRLP